MFGAIDPEWTRNKTGLAIPFALALAPVLRHEEPPGTTAVSFVRHETKRPKLNERLADLTKPDPIIIDDGLRCQGCVNPPWRQRALRGKNLEDRPLDGTQVLPHAR